MAGVTSTGFEIKTYDEQLSDITTLASTPEYYGEQFPTTPDSIFHILAGIISASLKDHYDISKAVASQGNRDEASGKYLDDLAALNGIDRLNAAPSTGSILYKGTDNTLVPLGSTVKFTTSSTLVIASEDTLVTRTSCYRMKVAVPSATNGLSYILRINNFQYFAIGNVSSTTTTIRDALISAINGATSTQGLVAIADGTSSLVITLNEYRNGMTLNIITNLTLNTVSTFVRSQTVNSGLINLYAGQTVTLVGSILGITGVENLVDWSVGREVETDEELRIRMDNKEATRGTATKPAIESSINNLDGVLSSLLVENTSFITDSGGRPPKSYEVFIEGGSDDDIAEELWRTKPAGISTHGSVSKIIVDANGDEQEVQFSRFDNKYGWVRVSYQLNPEEVFPINGEDLIKTTVVTTGNGFDRGEDLDSTKFFGDLYTNVKGMWVAIVETAITDSPLDTPTYNANRKSIPNTVKLLFDVSRTATTLQ